MLYAHYKITNNVHSLNIQNKKSVKIEEQTIMKLRTFISKN